MRFLLAFSVLQRTALTLSDLQTAASLLSKADVLFHNTRNDYILHIHERAEEVEEENSQQYPLTNKPQHMLTCCSMAC